VKRGRVQKGSVIRISMEYTTQSKGKGIISLLTAGLGLYFTAAMWTEFNSALGLFFGPSLGIIVGTIVFLLYQSKKNENEFTEGGNYLTSEATQIIQDEDGHSKIIESTIEKGRNPTFLIGGVYLLIVLMSESSWSDLLF
tara:strand:- start:7286 stop:7705 length:420 start_codon:yes stop_codon:yes gene_type:complete